MAIVLRALAILQMFGICLVWTSAWGPTLKMLASFETSCLLSTSLVMTQTVKVHLSLELRRGVLLCSGCDC